jgi:hypothetical protein
MDDEGNELEALAQPVNSAAYWTHLYVEDEVEVVEVIDLTSTEDDHEEEHLAPAHT